MNRCKPQPEPRCVWRSIAQKILLASFTQKDPAMQAIYMLAHERAAQLADMQEFMERKS